MKLSAAISNLGRPLAYYPSLARLLGVEESIFLCNFIYWTGSQRDPDGWIYKTWQELEVELGMSRQSQRTAQRKLCQRGLLEKKADRWNHRTLYRVNVEKLDELWQRDGVPFHKSLPDKTLKLDPTKVNSNHRRRLILTTAKVNSNHRIDPCNTSDNTHETTSGSVRRTDAPRVSPPLSEVSQLEGDLDETPNSIICDASLSVPVKAPRGRPKGSRSQTLIERLQNSSRSR